MMEPSYNAFALIKKFEGCVLTSYQDQAGIWTVGYGETGPDIVEGLTIAQQQAEQFLNHSVDNAAGAINDLVTLDINQNQFDAVTSFIFNMGRSAFASSTLLKYINADRCDEAADQFDLWVHIRIGGQLTVSQGLVARRAAEKALFIQEV